ncbi:MAG: HAD hydrolase-like protein [Candidatus Daviesbacteria bacterium]|nr:HAD hydrolase-like protein [Candidatus Daviesbacteria bacterium]
MIKLVAFDWNGTIFSDTSVTLEGVNEVFKFLKLSPISLKTFQKHFDVPVINSYMAMGISAQDLNKKSKEIAGVFHASYEQRSMKVRTRAYARGLLSRLLKNHINSIIFSNHIDEPIKKQLKRLKIERYFSAVLANSHLETAFNGRAKQEKLKNYLESQSLSAKEILIVGDTIEETEIGKELGCYTVAITHGFCSTTRLKAAKPDFLISNLKEVIKIVKSLKF